MSGADEQFLVPSVALKAMLCGVRLLQRAAAADSKKRDLRGLEAVWAAAVFALAPGDLLSLPAEPLSAEETGKLARVMGVQEGPRLLRAVGAGEPARLHASLGAAAALQAQGERRLQVVMAAADAVRPVEWRRVLAAAGAADLPMVFVVLPGASARDAGWLSAGSQHAGGKAGRGVPGMPVDGEDAVALSRVLQESAVRARAGDGPALLEAVRWRAPTRRGTAQKGAAERLRAVLQGRQKATKAKHGPGQRADG